MEIPALIDQLEAEGTALAAAAEAGGLDREIAHCPGWETRDVVVHLGGVHRWAAAIVGTAATGPDLPAGDAIGTGPADELLIDWFRQGHAALVATLRAAPSELACWSFLPAPSPLAFWARRQALETAVHRVDVASTTAHVTPIDPALALDGLDEMLLGFGGRRREFEPGTIRLEPRGGDPWALVLGPDGLAATILTDGAAAPDVPDVTIAGSASDVYLWTWNRPADVTIDGDAKVAARWQRVRVRWS